MQSLYDLTTGWGFMSTGLPTIESTYCNHGRARVKRAIDPQASIHCATDDRYNGEGCHIPQNQLCMPTRIFESMNLSSPHCAQRMASTVRNLCSHPGGPSISAITVPGHLSILLQQRAGPIVSTPFSADLPPLNNRFNKFDRRSQLLVEPATDCLDETFNIAICSESRRSCPEHIVRSQSVWPLQVA